MNPVQGAFFDTVDIDCPFEEIVLTDFEIGLLYREVWE